MKDGKTENDNRNAIADIAVLAGEIMISAGAETHRVEDTLVRILALAGGDLPDAFVFSTGFIITMRVPRSAPYTVTRRIRAGGTNLGRICRVNSVSRDLCEGRCSFAEALQRLREIKKESVIPVLPAALCTSVAAGGFALIYGKSFTETLGAAFSGLLLSLFSVFLGRVIRGTFLINTLGAAAVTIFAASLSHAAYVYASGMVIRSQYVIVGSIIPLLPGLIVTNAVRDTLGGDYISATARALEALVSAASVALGVGIGLSLCGAVGITSSVDFTFTVAVANAREALVAVIASGTSAAAVAVILNVPRRYIPVVSFTGAMIWVANLLSLRLGASVTIAVFLASAFADAMAWILARAMKAPVTPFLICGIIALVPGIGLYKTVYYIFEGMTDMVYGSLAQTLLTAGAIALAIFCVDAALDAEKRIAQQIKTAVIKRKNNP